MKTFCCACGSSLKHYWGTHDPLVSLCKNPSCPLRSKCKSCGEPLEPITEPFPVAQSRCEVESCFMFGHHVDDDWPARYAHDGWQPSSQH